MKREVIVDNSIEIEINKISNNTNITSKNEEQRK